MGKEDMDIHQLAAAARELVREIRSRAQAGDRLAKEGLDSIEETLARAAGVATDPTLPKGRRKQALKDAMKKIEYERSKTSKGV